MRIAAALLIAFTASTPPSKPAAKVALRLPADDKYLETIKVSDNVYVFKPKIDWTHGNGVAIIGPDGVFFIDTYIQFNYAEEAIRRLRQVTKLPVRYVLNTHWHNDHVMGNAVFKRVFPESRIITTDSTAAYLDRVIKPLAQDQTEGIEGNIAQLDSELKIGKITNRSIPLTGALREFWEWQLRDGREYQKQYHPEKIPSADITFGDTLTMRWGSQTLRMIHMTEDGHSSGDAIVWIPETRILIAGDLVVGPTPYATYFNTTGMIKAIHALIAMNPAIIIPGHGEVEHDLSYMKLSELAFSTYQQAGQQAVDAKIPVTTAIDSIAFPEIDKRFTGDDPVKQWAYRSFFARFVIYYAYKAAGALPPPKTP